MRSWRPWTVFPFRPQKWYNSSGDPWPSLLEDGRTKQRRPIPRHHAPFMHELSIVEALIEQVQREVRRAGQKGRVTRLELAIGTLSGRPLRLGPFCLRPPRPRHAGRRGGGRNPTAAGRLLLPLLRRGKDRRTLSPPVHAARVPRSRLRTDGNSSCRASRSRRRLTVRQPAEVHSAVQNLRRRQPGATGRRRVAGRRRSESRRPPLAETHRFLPAAQQRRRMIETSGSWPTQAICG